MGNIGILTSGGDAPGMNACIRAVVRSAVEKGNKVIGVQSGYQGLIEGRTVSLGLRDVGNIIQSGGTILKTSRSNDFMTASGFKKALATIKKEKLDCLIVIGGNGSLAGALALKDAGVNIIGIPATIDNDLGYTDVTLGFDTAVNTVTNLLNNVRDTSNAHERVSVVEVMGRHCGDIALFSGISAGADAIIIPEIKTEIKKVSEKLINSAKTGKLGSIVVVAEGAGRASDIAKEIEAKTGLESKAVVIGHLQRGGSPTMADRLLASRFGVFAIDLAENNRFGYAIATRGGKVEAIDLKDALSTPNTFDVATYEINNRISI